jgi:hypothetical protein
MSWCYNTRSAINMCALITIGYAECRQWMNYNVPLITYNVVCTHESPRVSAVYSTAMWFLQAYYFREADLKSVDCR